MTIWKYPIEIIDAQVVEMPEGATILDVQAQDDVPCIWALVDPEKPSETRTILTYGTGHPIDNRVAMSSRHIGTYQIKGGKLVFHVFISEEVH
jgi:hypothetical protein